MRRAIVSSVGVALCLAAASPSYAQSCYALENMKWCAVSGGLHRVPVQDFSSAAWPVSASLSAWNYASPINSLYLYKVTSGAYAYFYDADYGNTSWLGVTTLVQSGGCLTPGRVVVQFNDHYAAHHTSVTLHETGHSIGLAHVIGCSIVMNNSTDPACYPSQLSSCDGLGADVIYP